MEREEGEVGRERGMQGGKDSWRDGGERGEDSEGGRGGEDKRAVQREDGEGRGGGGREGELECSADLVAQLAANLIGHPLRDAHGCHAAGLSAAHLLPTLTPSRLVQVLR